MVARERMEVMILWSGCRRVASRKFIMKMFT